MARDRTTTDGRRRVSRRGAIALCGVLAGMASAALLTEMVRPPVSLVRGAI